MFKLRTALLALTAGTLVLAASGCATFRGGPKALISPKQLEAKSAFQVGDLIENLAVAENEDQRTLATTKLLAVCDIRYMEFRHEIVANRKHSRAASNALSLMSDVAASLTDSIGVKDNYIALSVLIQGGNNIYDKDYMFDRTLDALVAQMDANRKAKLLEIRRAMSKSINEYPGASALADVIDYYHAGTINGAIVGVQKSANEEEERSAKALRELEPVTQSEIAQREADVRWFADFIAGLDTAGQKKLQKFIESNGGEVEAENDDFKRTDRLKQAMNRLRKDKKSQFPDTAAVKKALQADGFRIAP